MARLTLSEQVTALNLQAAELTASLASAQSTAKADSETIARLSQEVQTLRPLTAKLEQMQKEFDSAKSMRDHYDRQATAASNEIEQCHMVLDGVEGAPAKEFDGEYGKKSRNVVTRLAGAFLASTKTGGVK